MPLHIKYLITFRKVQLANNKIIKAYYIFKLWRISRKSGIEIPESVSIGKGFRLSNFGRIIISPNAVIGKNVNIATGVMIGVTNRGERKGVPIIGDKVWIGTNAVIVGKITIGDDVLIAPNAYVNFDVPSHAIVLGNPGKIYLRDNASERYIVRTV
jgi:serine O-acetyltransferase